MRKSCGVQRHSLGTAAALVLLCLLTAVAPQPCGGRALSRSLAAAQRAGSRSDAAPAVAPVRTPPLLHHALPRHAHAAAPTLRTHTQVTASTPSGRFEPRALHFHISVWLIILLVLLSCCVLSSCLVAQHGQLVRACAALTGATPACVLLRAHASHAPHALRRRRRCLRSAL